MSDENICLIHGRYKGMFSPCPKCADTTPSTGSDAPHSECKLTEAVDDDGRVLCPIHSDYYADDPEYGPYSSCDHNGYPTAPSSRVEQLESIVRELAGRLESISCCDATCEDSGHRFNADLIRRSRELTQHK